MSSRARTCVATGAGERALAEAAEWHLRLAEDDASGAEQRAFDEWLRRDAEHQLAWHEIQSTWEALAGARQTGLRAALEQNYREERRAARRLRRRGGGMLLWFATLLTGVWLAMGSPAPDHLLADHHTIVGERRHLILPDGSELVLNTASAVDIHFDARERRVLLHDGEIHISVAPVPSRPLAVVTPEARVAALGTRFSVRRMAGHDGTLTRVSVHESRVELCPAGVQDRCRRLEAGEQSAASPSVVSPPTAMAPEARPDWLRGRLEVRDRPLPEVLDELARYHRGVLRYRAPALAGIRVSGVLPLDDPDRALDALAASLPIRVSRYSYWWVVVSPGG